MTSARTTRQLFSLHSVLPAFVQAIIRVLITTMTGANLAA
jgi:hypothetical protein